VKSSEQDALAARNGGRKPLNVSGAGLPGIGKRGTAPGRPMSSGPPKLMVRWLSALPMQEAELKAHDVGAPGVDDNHYVIVVSGIPRGSVIDDSKQQVELLKRQASLTFLARQDIKPSSVEILLHENEAVVVYSFPRSEEITWREHQISFNAQIATLKIVLPFNTDDMTLHGKLEL
jgi:hypothetical protein